MKSVIDSARHSQPATCDNFCNVIDNYGDIGVCWRLARQPIYEIDLSGVIPIMKVDVKVKEWKKES